MASHRQARVRRGDRQGAANGNGDFSITVTVPFMGQPDADVVASCDNTSGTTTNVTVIPIGYTSA